MIDINKSLNKYFIESCIDTLENRIPDNSLDLVVTSPPYDCYSEDTKVLTYSGWKNIADVLKTDKIFTLNPQTKEVYWENCINTYKYDFEGNMINFKNQNIDILVTPNHKMYVEDSQGEMVRERIPFKKKEDLKSSYFKVANKINTSHRLRMSGFKWEGNSDEYFILPELNCVYNKQNVTFEEKKIPMIWWVRFLGMHIAEGGCSGTGKGKHKQKRYSTSIKQKNKETVSLIRTVLNNLGFTFHEYIGKNDIVRFEITNRQLWEYLFKLGNSHTKFVPQEIKDLSTKYLNEFFYYYLLGDGYNNRSNRYVQRLGCTVNNNDDVFIKFYGFRSVSKRLREDLIEISIKLGRISKELKNDNVFFYNRGTFIKYRKNEKYYKGKVYCIEVQHNNIILVKRNEKIIFCGNSIRSYNNNYSFDFETVAGLLAKKIKVGGVIVWVVGDATIKGSETGTSFRQALYFKDECNLRLHDTMLFEKNTTTFPARRTGKRYSQIFEYVFILSRGTPKTANLICDKKNRWAGTTNFASTKTDRNKNDKLVAKKKFKPIPDFSPRNNIWKYTTGKGFGSSEDIAYEHPAIFPFQLAIDHVTTWTNPNNIVYDPFLGSGTVAKAAQQLGRNFIGSELNPKYEYIIKKRLENV